MTYNGWTNYETWATGMFLDGNYDGEGTYHHVLELAADSANVYDLSVQLQAFVEDSEVDVATGLAADLLGAAMSEINWMELAEAKLAEIAEES